MGYEVHITRKNDFYDEYGEKISIEEWKDYISRDREMRLDGFAEVKMPEGTLRVEGEGLAVWVNWSRHKEEGGKAWMDYFEGNITAKYPDEEILRKMHQISLALNAKVQGDDGEIYDASGQSNWQELREQSINQRAQASRKWWKFWK